MTNGTAPAASGAAKAGIGFGSALAITISWSAKQVDSLGDCSRLPVVDLRDLLCRQISLSGPELLIVRIEASSFVFWLIAIRSSHMYRESWAERV